MKGRDYFKVIRNKFQGTILIVVLSFVKERKTSILSEGVHVVSSLNTSFIRRVYSKIFH